MEKLEGDSVILSEKIIPSIGLANDMSEGTTFLSQHLDSIVKITTRLWAFRTSRFMNSPLDSNYKHLNLLSLLQLARSETRRH